MNNNYLAAYAFDELHRPVAWRLIKTHDVGVVMKVVDRMLDIQTDAKHIYVLPATNALKRDYHRAAKSTDFVDWICFEDEVARLGLCFYSED